MIWSNGPYHFVGDMVRISSQTWNLHLTTTCLSHLSMGCKLPWFITSIMLITLTKTNIFSFTQIKCHSIICLLDLTTWITLLTSLNCFITYTRYAQKVSTCKVLLHWHRKQCLQYFHRLNLKFCSLYKPISAIKREYDLL